MDLGYTVNYVYNITDIDDKIIWRAAEQQETIQALIQQIIAAMFEDIKALHLLLPNQELRATDYIL